MNNLHNYNLFLINFWIYKNQKSVMTYDRGKTYECSILRSLD